MSDIKVPQYKRTPILKALRYIKLNKPFDAEKLVPVTGKSVRVIMYQLRQCGFIFDRYFDGHKVEEYILMKEPEEAPVYRIMGELMHKDSKGNGKAKGRYMRNSVIRKNNGRQTESEELKVSV